MNRALVVTAAAAIAGAALTHAQPASRATISPPPAVDWNHVRLVGEQLGVPRTVVFGASPARSVAVGDFDGDGDADIAVAASSGDVTVLLGDAALSFTTTLGATRADWPRLDAETDVNGVAYRAQSSPISSTTTIRYRASGEALASRDAGTGDFGLVADLDDDGAVDVVAASPASSALLVRRGAAGGRSASAGTVAIRAPPIALASGDFDGDHITDLALAHRSSSLTLLFGADGFARSRTIAVGIVPAPHGLAVSDINGDGTADVVVLGSGSDVSVLLGDGQGGLMPYATATVNRPAPVERVKTTTSRTSGQDFEGVASITLSPSTIAGGSGGLSTGTITLNAPAPTGGVVVSLASSNLDLAASVPSVTVPAGATTATFAIGTNRNYRRYSGLAFTVAISAAHDTTIQSATLSVTAQPRPGPLSSFDVQNQGPMCFGVGVRQSQTGIELEFGSAGNLFDCVPPDNPVGQDGTCTFRQECALGCELRPPVNGSQFNDVCAATGPFPVAVSPRLVVGGTPSVASLALSAAAPASSLGRLSSATVLANTIPNIRFPIPTGNTTATAEVLTARVASPLFAPIDGDYFTPRPDGSRGGRIGLGWLALVPGAAPAFALTSFDFDPPTLTSVAGGTVFFAIGQLNQVAPAPGLGAATMTVSSSDPSAASIPQPTITFTEGSSSSGVGIQTHAVSSDTVVTISAVVGDTTQTRQLTVRATPTATRAKSFFLDPLIVTGGATSTATVVLDGAAPAGGAQVTLSSSNAAIAAMPATITVAAGSDRVSFSVQTFAVSTDTTVTLRATFGNGSALTSLIVTAPPAPPGATLTAVAVSPSSVTGGATSQGTVTLTGAAPSGGANVSLSDNSTSVSTPASVTVPAGSTSASFTVTTTSVTTATSATITAVFGGVTRTTLLTVNPATAPSAPTLVSPANQATNVPQPVLLDWNNVTNATSYEVQVDNSSTIAAPFVANPTVTVSQATLAAGLPAQQLWWRVRARNAAGVFGPFSSTRSFTPQGAAGPAATLTVTATGRSGERVTSTPAGINVNVGSTGSAGFNTGTAITLRVTNDRDAIWSGACSSGGNKTKTCTFTLTGSAQVNANVQ